MKLPQKTLPDEILRIITILGPKVTGSTILDAKKIDPSLFEDEKVSTCDFLGLIFNTDKKLVLSPAGRDLYKAINTSPNELEKYQILQERIRQIPIFDRTLEYFFHNKNFSPTKIDIASYWHDNFQDELQKADEEVLTNAAIFFLRFVEFSGLGKYIQAGNGRDTHCKLDQVKLAEFITSASPTPETIMKFQQVKKEETQETETRKTIETHSQPNTTNSGALSSSNIRAIQKLQLELTDEDLDSPGAKKLIIDMLDRLEKENTVLKAKVESKTEIEKKAAILEEKVKSLSKSNLLRTSINSIGGVLIGMSLSLTELLQKIIIAALGVILIFVSIFLREKDEPVGEDN